MEKLCILILILVTLFKVNASKYECDANFEDKLNSAVDKLKTNSKEADVNLAIQLILAELGNKVTSPHTVA